MKTLSVVATLYNSSAHLPEFMRRIRLVLQRIGRPFEIVLVNDGCPSGSLETARQLQESCPELTVIDLSRNFGHHRAQMVGLAHAAGDWIYLTDVDLEEPPEVLLDCWSEHERNPDVDVLYGLDDTKKGTAISRFFSVWFYRLFNAMSEVKLQENFLVSRLMNRNYVEGLLRHQERVLFLGGVFVLAGYKQSPVPARKLLLPHSSNYTFRRRVIMAVNAITSFSERPLILVFTFGAALSAVSFLAFFSVIALQLTDALDVPGWASIMCVLSFFMGNIFFSIGIIGIYLARIFFEVKQRPTGLIRRIHSA